MALRQEFVNFADSKTGYQLPVTGFRFINIYSINEEVSVAYTGNLKL
jgi:hypothetical protein